MNDPLRRPLHGVAVYNPDLLSKEELIAHFVARQPLLQRFMEDLRRKGTTQHHLIIGQRGMGKTTLLRRLRYAIEDDPELSRIWLPLTFPEEQYNVARLSDLYLNCIDALGDALEELGRHADARSLDKAVADLPPRDEAKRAQKALEILRGGARLSGRRLLLLVDNIELILDRLKSEQWAIRELLSTDGWLLLIGASASAIEATYKYQEAFYDFFQIHELRGLSEAESREVLRHLARMSQSSHVERILDEDPARLRATHVLTGGNPRTIVLLSSVLAQGPLGDVRSDLERLLDLCTPLYKARFEALPAQSQHVVDAIAVHWHPISAGELAGIVRLDTNTVSAQLNRLCQQGLVEKVAYEPATRTGFQIAERFFNIWYLMRASRRVRRRLLWLVEFLRMLYGHGQVEQQARQHLSRSESVDAGGGLRHAEYGLALAEVVADKALRGALESASVRALMLDRELREQIGTIVDLEGVDTSLKPLAERHRMMAEIREAVLSARVRKKGWDAESFWQMLGGSLSLSQAEKIRIAVSLDGLSASQLSRLRANFESELNGLCARFGADVVGGLRNAFRCGYMTHLEDVQGAEAAALVLDAPGVFALALAMRLEKVFDEQSAMVLERVVAGVECAYPWFVLGKLLQFRLGRHEEAEAAYRKAIELDPKSVYAWTGLAILLKKHPGRYDESEAAYRKVIELDPKFAYPWTALGILLGKCLGRYEEAEAAYRKAIELDPKSVYPWYGLGRLLGEHLGRYEEAEVAYRNAIKADSKSAGAWNCLAWLLYERDRVDEETEAAARHAVALAPQNNHCLHTLATILVRRGRWEEAAEQARQFIGSGTPEFHEETWSDIVLFFREAVAIGRSQDAASLLDDLGMGERWQPLREALLVLASGTPSRLRRIAPEIRQPAEQLISMLSSEP